MISILYVSTVASSVLVQTGAVLVHSARFDAQLSFAPYKQHAFAKSKFRIK